MYLFIIICSVIVSVLLIGIVLIQKSKGGGLSSQFGGASASLGVRQTNSILDKGTWWLAGILVFLSIVSAYTIPTAQGDQLRTQQEQSAAMPGTNQYDTNAQPVMPAEAPAETPAQ